MKKLKELKDSRNQKIEAMKAITAKMEEEQRSVRTDEEKDEFTNLRTEIESLDKEIEDAEYEERTVISKVEETSRANRLDGGEDKDLRKYNLFKALREGANPTGLEKELRDEARREIKEAGGDYEEIGVQIPRSVLQRAVFDTTAGANLVHTKQDETLYTHDKRLVSSQMPVRILDGLNGKLDLTSMADISAAFTDEGVAVSDIDPTPSKVTIQPEFVSANQPFSKQYLNQTNPVIQQQVLNQFNYAISKAVEKRLFDKVYALTAKSGYEAASAWPSGEEYSILLEMEKDLEYGNGILVSNDVKAVMKNTFIDAGSGMKVWDDGEVNNYQAFSTSLLAANSVIMGSWEDAVIGYWGGIEVILDPFSKKRTGEIDIQISRLADAAVANSSSFSVVKNYAKSV